MQRVWVNSRQPQTLYLTQILMYVQGGSGLFFGLTLGVPGSTLFGLRILAVAYIALVVVGKLVAAYGIANAMRWAYRLGIAAATAPLLLRVLDVVRNGSGLLADPISLMFDIALLALLLHPQSRAYQKLWFR